MSQKFKQKQIDPDPLYNDVLVAKFINHIMRKGKKSVAVKIVYSAFEEINKQTKKDDSLEIFKKALDVVGPSVAVKARRIGGATYQVPQEVKGKRKVSLAMRWIIEAARKKKGKTMIDKLFQEIILASKNEGDAVKKRINIERIAAANRAFAYMAK